MRSPFLLVLLLVAFALAFAAGCGGAGNAGDACSRPNTEGECVDGAICVTDETPEGASSDPVWESYTCRALCDEQADCAAGEQCRGVSGAPMISACQPTRTP